MAVSSDRNEPTIRPRTPTCAPEETALLVPVFGPNRPIGARISAPTTTPSTVANTARGSVSPNMIGVVPMITDRKGKASSTARQHLFSNKTPLLSTKRSA